MRRLRGWARNELPPGALAKATASPTRAGEDAAAASLAAARGAAVPPSLVLGASAVCEHSTPSQLLARLRDADAHAVAPWRARNLGASAAAAFTLASRARTRARPLDSRTSRSVERASGPVAPKADPATSTARPPVVFGGPELPTSFVHVRPAERDRAPSPSPKFLGLVHSHSLLASVY